MKVAGAPGHRDRFRRRINDEPNYLQMIRSFKDKGLREHLGGKIKQELGLSKLGTIRYRTASGSDRPVVSLTSSTMKGPVATARGSVTISCSWHGQPSSRAPHNDSRYGDPFIAS